jgi:O-antigen ligase
VVVVSLSRVHVHLGLEALRPALVLALAAGAYALLSPHLANTRNLIHHWPAKAIIALGLLAVVSAPFGLSLGGSASYILGHYSKVLILAFLLIAAIRSVEDLSLFVWAVVASCGLLAYFALFVFELRMSPQSATARLGDLYTYDANDVSCILVSGLPLVLLVFQTSKLRGKLIAGAILIGIGATLARTGSRGGFVGFLVVGAALLLLVPRVSVVKRIGFVGAAVVGLVLYAPPGYWGQMRTLQNPTADYNWTSVDGRKRLAERGIGYMKAYPIFGLGIDNFARAEGTISEKALNFVDRTGVSLRWTAPHNSFVQVGAELGIPGLLLWSSILFGGILGMYRLRRRLPQAWARGDPSHRFLYYMTVYMPVALLGFAATSVPGRSRFRVPETYPFGVASFPDPATRFLTDAVAQTCER